MLRAIAVLLVLAPLVLAGAPGAKPDPLPALAFASDRSGNLDIFSLSPPDARVRRLTRSAHDEFSPAWSPDGRRIAYRVNPLRSDVGDIWVMRADGTRKRNLTRSGRTADWSPAWSPDGRLIAYYSSAAGGSDVWVMRPDGRGKRNVTRNGALNEYPSWSPDGRRLVFNSHRDGQFEVYRAGVDGTRQVNLTRSAASDKWPAWSPGGKLIAFESERDGNPDVFVMNVDGSEVRNLTRTPELEESHPTWMPDGRLSFIRHGTTGPIELWAVRADARNAVRLNVAAEPVFVFSWRRSLR